MIKISFKVNTELIRDRVEKIFQRKAKKFLDRVADQMRALMRLPKSGRRYKNHIASSPGQAPAIRSGTLIGSIGTPVIRGLNARLTVSAPYALYLEEGTADIAPRPFAGPAVEMTIQSLGGNSTFKNL